METNLIVFIYCNNKIMHLSDGSLPMKSILNTDNIKEQAVNLIKEIFGLRFKKEQIIRLEPDLEENEVNTICVMINLSYYPESYTSEEPIFIKLKDEPKQFRDIISDEINSFDNTCKLFGLFDD